MDRSEVKRIVEANLDDLKYRLGLGMWEIIVELDLRKTPPGEASYFVTQGQNIWHPDYEKASIKLDPDSLDTEEEVLDVLRHELYHLIDSPYTIVWNMLKPVLEGDPVRRDMVESVWTHAQERTNKNIQRMYQRLTRREDPPCETPSPTS